MRRWKVQTAETAFHASEQCTGCHMYGPYRTFSVILSLVTFCIQAMSLLW